MSSSLELLVFTFGFGRFRSRSVQVCSSFNPDLARSGPELGRSGATPKLEENWPDLENIGNYFFDDESYSQSLASFGILWLHSVLSNLFCLIHIFLIPDLARTGPDLDRSGAVPKLERNWPDLGENWSPNAGTLMIGGVSLLLITFSCAPFG